MPRGVLPVSRLRRRSAGGHGPPHVRRRRSRRCRHPPRVHRGRRAIRHRGIAPPVSGRRARPQRARVRSDHCRMDAAAGAGRPRGSPAAAPVSAAGTAPPLSPASRGDGADRRRAAGGSPGTAAKPTAAINPAGVHRLWRLIVSSAQPEAAPMFCNWRLPLPLLRRHGRRWKARPKPRPLVRSRRPLAGSGWIGNNRCATGFSIRPGSPT